MTTFTIRGAALLGAELALLMVGILMRDGILITIAIALFLLLIGTAIIGRRNLAKLRIELDIPHRAHAGKTIPATARIINARKILDAYQLHLTLLIPGTKSLHAEAKWIPTTCGAEHHIRPLIPMRASTLEIPYQITSHFPFRLFKNQRRSTIPTPLIIYPRLIIPQEIKARGSLDDLNPGTGTTHGDAHGEPRGIRQYQPGDPAKKIHWPASARSLARGHQIRVRENDPPGYHPEFIHIIFHSHGTGEMLREDRFERAISLLAGTLHHLRTHTIRTRLQADFLGWHTHPCETRPQYLETLAILAQTQRAQGTELHELQNALTKIDPRHATIILSDMSPETWLPLIKTPPNTTHIDIRQTHFQKRQTKNGAATKKITNHESRIQNTGAATKPNHQITNH